MPVPVFALRLAFGRPADEVLLGGRRVLAEKAAETGCQFLYPSLHHAVREIVG